MRELKHRRILLERGFGFVAPSRVRELKLEIVTMSFCLLIVAPSRVRELKLSLFSLLSLQLSRTLTGA